MSNIIIAGGGFAGLWAAMAAAATRHRANADTINITLVSKVPDLCIRPRLYEGARPEMLVPLQPLLETIGVTFVRAEISAVSTETVQTREAGTLGHDRLILAMGSHVAVPPVPGAKDHGFTVDGYTETARLDTHLAKLDLSGSDNAQVVVVGAGFSGLEIATSLRDRLGPNARLYLIDHADVAGQSLGPNLTDTINQALDRANITFLGGEAVASVTADQLTLRSGKVIDTQTSIFATGSRPSPLIDGIGTQAGDGRLQTDATLRIPVHPTIFAAGDVAVASTDSQHMTLMSCQHAMPMGLVAGQNAVRDLLGKDMLRYAQPDYVTCLSLGKSDAVFTKGWDRSIVLTGQDGAQLKSQINEMWIYPPSPDLGRDAIFDTVLPTGG